MGIIRLILAISVVIAHTSPVLNTQLVGGQLAVQAFYIISGFYMSLILNEKYINKNNSYSLFITNRFIRLYPIYWIVLLATISFSTAVVILSKGHYLSSFKSYYAVKFNWLSFLYLIITNIIIFGQDIIMFLGITPTTGKLYFTSNFINSTPPLHSFLFVPQAWTLGLELTFYVLAPLLLKRGMKVVLPIIISSFILRCFLYNILGLQHDPWTYRFFPTEIMFFLFGFISYRIYVRLKKLSISDTAGFITLIYILLLTIFYYKLPYIKLTFMPFSSSEIIYISSIVTLIPVLFIYFKKSSWDIHIGELSYPVYICHMLVIKVCKDLPFLHINSTELVILSVLLVAYILNKVVAVPIERYRQSRLKN